MNYDEVKTAVSSLPISKNNGRWVMMFLTVDGECEWFDGEQLRASDYVWLAAILHDYAMKIKDKAEISDDGKPKKSARPDHPGGCGCSGCKEWLACQIAETEGE